VTTMARRLTVIPPLPLAVYLASAGPLPFPLDGPDARTWQRGRHALWQGIRAIGLRAGDEVLLPAYHHGSEVETYLRAGLVPRFYDSGPLLVPDAPLLEAAMTPAVRVLHLVHHLGRPTRVGPLRAWCDAVGVRLVEDAAQAWLATDDRGAPVGSAGDAAIFSLYKAVPVPDGGALALRTGGPASRPIEASLGLRGVAGRHLAWAGATLPIVGAIAARRSPPPYDPAADFGVGDPWRAASTLTRRLLSRLDLSTVAQTRLANYRRLAASLARWMPEGFRDLPEGASPFALPVHVADKQRARARLLDGGIRAVDAWSAPHPSLEARRFPDAAAWRASTLLLPVHQYLVEGDIARISEVAAEALGPTPGSAPVRG